MHIWYHPQANQVTLFEQGRIWSDDDHVAFQEAEKLRQFIEARQ